MVIDRTSDGADSSFYFENYLDTATVKGTIEGLRRLGQERFPNAIHIVSTCEPGVKARSRE